METDKIREIVDAKLTGSELYLVDLRLLPGDEIEVTVDCDGSVSIDSCIELSRAIEAELDREEEDFQLTVTSAGVGQPLKVFRQYQKLIGKPVEVVLKNGVKILAELEEATPESITLSYTEKRIEEGKKRKEEVKVRQSFVLEDVKSTAEYLDFK